MNTQNLNLDTNELILALLGVEHMAYIKQVIHEKGNGFAVFAADGTRLAIFPTHESAHFMARKNNLELVSVH
jgi:hypothetical protein